MELPKTRLQELVNGLGYELAAFLPAARQVYEEVELFLLLDQYAKARFLPLGPVPKGGVNFHALQRSTMGDG